MKAFFYIATLLLLLVLISCTESDTNVSATADTDSLTSHIKNVVEQKKQLQKIKDAFEKSRYSKSLNKYRPIIRKYAKRYGFDWRLIVAQIMQESKFREAARSPVGARGLMQVMPRTARELTQELDVQYILINPRENIAAGIYHLRKQYNFFPTADKENRLKLGLASYNSGAGRVFDAQEIIKYYGKPALKWKNVRQYIQRLKKSDWELHLQVWPLGRPKHGYFYGYNETINYVDNIWEMYQIYRKIL
jgi:membrane-bound lytic murein transglycosylase F